MTIKLLTQKEFPIIKRLKSLHSELRVINESSRHRLQSVEIFNKNGKFRGFGRSTKEAFVNALNALKNRSAK